MSIYAVASMTQMAVRDSQSVFQVEMLNNSRLPLRKYFVIKSVLPMTNRAINYLLTMAEKKCSGLNLLQAKLFYNVLRLAVRAGFKAQMLN